MAPEQATAYDQVDPSCDMYSLGAVAYDLLTGQPPFVGKNPVEIVMAHAHREVVPPSELQPSVPAELEQSVLRCLQKVPEQRFPDVVSLERALSYCACAGQWTDQVAESWWRANEPQTFADFLASEASASRMRFQVDAEKTVQIDSAPAEGTPTD